MKMLQRPSLRYVYDDATAHWFTLCVLIRYAILDYVTAKKTLQRSGLRYH